MVRRVLCLLCSVVIVTAVSLTVRFLSERTYPVSADGSNLPEEVAFFMSRGRQPLRGEDFRFYDTVDVGTKRFVLMELVGTEFEGMNLGLVRLERGWNGAYRIDSVSHGGGNFRNEAVEWNGQWYLLFGGRNAYFGIRNAEFYLEGERVYSVEIPQRDRFFVFVELEKEPERKHLLPVEQIRLYDVSGRDITEEIPWN